MTKLKGRALLNAPPPPNNATKNKTSVRPIFYKVSEVIYTARRMFGLPIKLNNDFLPWGYDSILEVDGAKYAIPNDEAFKLLVQGKYLLKDSSFRKLGLWLGHELHLAGYNFQYVRNYNPNRGMSEQSVNRIYKFYTPQDACVLPLDEREQLYRLEIESSGVDCQALAGYTSQT